MHQYEHFLAHARDFFKQLKKDKLTLTPETVPFPLPLSGISPNSESPEDAKYI